MTTTEETAAALETACAALDEVVDQLVDVLERQNR